MRMVLVLVVAAIACGGCSLGPTDGWRVEKLVEVPGLDVPESAGVDAETGDVFVSNIVATTKGANRFNAADGRGFITRLKTGGRFGSIQWVGSEINAPLNSIKGICVLKGVLYTCDIDHVRRMSVKTGQALEPIIIHGAKLLNDAATDGKYIYVSDTTTNKIHRLDGDKQTAIPAPPSVNGIVFSGGKIFAASWEAHEIYEVDLDGIMPPKPFGLAGRFGGLDGIDILADGTFIVSDSKKNKIILVSADRKRMRTLLKIKGGPVDFGIDHARGLLYIPLFWNNSLAVYKLTNTRK
jgi:hypothetical protein